MNLEKATLAAIIAEPEQIHDITLTPTDFADPNHGALWQLVTSMADEREPITELTVMEQLHRVNKDLPRLDVNFLAELISHAPIPASLGARYARDVANAAALRRLTAAGTRIVQLAQAGGDAREIQESARREVDAATTETVSAGFIGDTIDETIASLDQPSRAIPTPWADLNQIITGWEPGSLYVIGARPSVGKSIMALQAGIGLAEHGTVSYITLEMGTREVDQRVLAQLAEVPLGRLKGESKSTEKLTPRDWERIHAVQPYIKDMPLAVHFSGNMTAVAVKSHARSVNRSAPLSAIVVDYLQLMNPPPGDRRPRHEVVADFSRSLKLLAMDMQVPVIALTQLNRNSANEKRRPTMNEIRESGAVEQDADVVILLHAEDEMSNELEVIVEKNRQGAKARTMLSRRGEFARLDSHQWTPYHHRYEN